MYLITETTKKVNQILSKEWADQYGYFIEVIPSPSMMIGKTEKGAYVYFNYAGSYRVVKDVSKNPIGCYLHNYK